ncbi:MAG TPA: GNAT family N-acetyltransferase [Moheibacter sp.]|nr:GNAT family N-acetyltransferase [Moheibacter sp.]
MKFNLQPDLSNEMVRLLPLQKADFERLYAVASDPEIWKNHPNKNRFEKAVFRNFFEGALESGGAFLIQEAQANAIIGSSRFYDFDETKSSIFIGYTFYAVDYWGKGYNAQVKKMMLDYIFQFVDQVIFHVGIDNHRSIRAMEKLGAEKIKEIVVAYFGEPDRNNVEFRLLKSNWVQGDQ